MADMNESVDAPAVIEIDDSSDFEIPEEELAQLKQAPIASSSINYDLSSTLGTPSTTQHELNETEIDRYLYPVNMPVRDYQRNMIRRALIRNIICAIPTGLGKTFIASVVMWNWYRWTKRAKVIFVAPTRPLVTQQVQNFLEITGVSVKDTCVLLQDIVKKADRELMWQTKRVFFATPQTVENDLRSGFFDPRDLVCIVIDEAHRATGNHSYVNLVREIKKENESFRVLALTATPSGKFDGVQMVIDSLYISATEIRTEESLDIRQYTHAKEINEVIVEPDSMQKQLFQLLRALLEPFLKVFVTHNIVHTSDPIEIHPFMFQTNIRKFMSHGSRGRSGQRSGGGGGGQKFYIKAKGDALFPVIYAIHLLKVHGIYQFYQRMESIRQKFIHTPRPGKNTSQLCNAPEFGTIIQACRETIYQGDSSAPRNPNFFGHPKLRQLRDILEGFYRVHGADSRCIIFAEFRDTAAEIKWVLEQHCPMVEASLFVGQASSASGDKGMTQKQQQALLDKFKDGDINVLIATSVAEEGLDIAQVDLIICYDQSSSPIRSIQRMGRTGRARDGNVYILMTPKEKKKLDMALGGHKWVENRINKGTNSSLQLEYHPSPRILPSTLNQKYVEVTVKPPQENIEAVENGTVLEAMKPPRRQRERRGSKKKARLDIHSVKIYLAGNVSANGSDEETDKEEEKEEVSNDRVHDTEQIDLGTLYESDTGAQEKNTFRDVDHEYLEHISRRSEGKKEPSQGFQTHSQEAPSDSLEIIELLDSD